MSKILVVEDDKDLSEITCIRLKNAGYEADDAFTCAEALARIEDNTYDLILLDVMLPDARGDELCGTVRMHSRCPIIFMSCLDDSGTIVGALNNGGDDYMVKPVDFDVLLARIEANIRRSQIYQEASVRKENGMLLFRQFSVDPVHHSVRRGEEDLMLSAIEYALLWHLISHPGTLLLYRELYEAVWDSDSLDDVRTLMVHISNLRKKVDPMRSGIIETVRGAGYIFTDK